ncbi:MAG: ATPase V, partial [Paraprevotella sp.]|nr:ATPase V [Paraprevotella sp.]
MIERMKKLTFLIYYKDYEAFLRRIQEMGVLHVQTTQEGALVPTSELETKLRQTEHVKELISRLEALEPSGHPREDEADAKTIVADLDAANEFRRQAGIGLQRLTKDEALLQPWGNFDPQKVANLSHVGYVMSFFVCPERAFDREWEYRYNATVITRDTGKVYFVTITPRGEEVALEAEKQSLPQVSLNDLRKQIKEKELQIAASDEAVRETASCHVARLQAYEDELRTSVAFDRVVLGTERVADDRLMVLQGWIPEDRETEVKAFLSREEVYYEIRAARKEDNAPIKLKNNAFVRMYEMLTKMYGMPDYGEFDPTPMIAPFFTLFFAFCLGDSGYGLILIALGFFLKRKLSKSLAGMMNLVITLGCATTVFGAILGTFFGVSLFDLNLPESVKQFMIAGKISCTNYDKQMLLAIIIGIVHISVAMTVKAIVSTVRYGFKESLSAWGWMILVVGFVATGSLAFLKLLPDGMSTWLFIAIGTVSALGIYLFNDIHRNVLINVGTGLWDTYNMASGLMGDVLSYLRLYALGLAGGLLGGVFNQLAFMVHDAAGGVLGIIGCGLILVLGHSLNIAMSCLSAFVHPLRLTFVEYFKNSGYDGQGKAYEPFSVYGNN